MYIFWWYINISIFVYKIHSIIAASDVNKNMVLAFKSWTLEFQRLWSSWVQTSRLWSLSQGFEHRSLKTLSPKNKTQALKIFPQEKPASKLGKPWTLNVFSWKSMPKPRFLKQTFFSCQWHNLSIYIPVSTIPSRNVLTIYKQKPRTLNLKYSLIWNRTFKNFLGISWTETSFFNTEF